MRQPITGATIYACCGARRRLGCITWALSAGETRRIMILAGRLTISPSSRSAHVVREYCIMNMRSHVSGTTAVLELSGRFDSYVAPRAAEWLEKIATGSPAHVVVNMAEVNFV